MKNSNFVLICRLMTVQVDPLCLSSLFHCRMIVLCIAFPESRLTARLAAWCTLALRYLKYSYSF